MMVSRPNSPQSKYHAGCMMAAVSDMGCMRVGCLQPYVQCAFKLILYACLLHHNFVSVFWRHLRQCPPIDACLTKWHFPMVMCMDIRCCLCLPGEPGSV